VAEKGRLRSICGPSFRPRDGLYNVLGMAREFRWTRVRALKEIRSQGQSQNAEEELSEKDLLTTFEQIHISPHYKWYYMTKRHNFFTAIQQCSYLWHCYMLIDRILCREFEIMMEIRDPKLMLPMVLFMNGHAKIRDGLRFYSFADCGITKRKQSSRSKVCVH